MGVHPDSIAAFLALKRIAVVGVSRQGGQAANHVFQKLQKAEYEVYPVNPKTHEVLGVRCYPSVASVPVGLEGVVIATPPLAAVEVVRECAAAGVSHVWFHRSFGGGSVSGEAVRECRALGIVCVVGGCPLMYCEPVDVVHRCMRWWLGKRGRVPV